MLKVQFIILLCFGGAIFSSPVEASLSCKDLLESSSFRYAGGIYDRLYNPNGRKEGHFEEPGMASTGPYYLRYLLDIIKRKNNLGLLGPAILEVGPFYHPVLDANQMSWILRSTYNGTKGLAGLGIDLTYWEYDDMARKALEETFRGVINKTFEREYGFPREYDTHKKFLDFTNERHAEPGRFHQPLLARVIKGGDLNDARSYDHAGKKYDTIILSQVLNYVDYKFVLEKLVGLLNPGGVLILTNTLEQGDRDFFHPLKPQKGRDIHDQLVALGMNVFRTYRNTRVVEQEEFDALPQRMEDWAKEFERAQRSFSTIQQRRGDLTDALKAIDDLTERRPPTYVELMGSTIHEIPSGEAYNRPDISDGASIVIFARKKNEDEN